MGERIEDAAARELFEETGVTAEPLTVFDAVDVFDHDADGPAAPPLHPGGRAVPLDLGEPVAGDDASQAGCRWPSWTRRRWP